MSKIILDKAYIGTSDVDKIYIGSNLLYTRNTSKYTVRIYTEPECSVVLSGIINKTLTGFASGQYTAEDVPIGTINYVITRRDFNNATGTIVLTGNESSLTKKVVVPMYPRSKLTNKIGVAQHNNMGGLRLRSDYVIKSDIYATVRVNNIKDFTVHLENEGYDYYWTEGFSVSETGYPEKVVVTGLSIASDDYYNYTY